MTRFFSAAILICVVCPPASANDKFKGKWVNVAKTESRKNTTPSLEIRENDDGWTLQANLDANGQVVDGEKIRLQWVGESTHEERFDHGFAVKNQSVSDIYYTVSLDKSQLVLEKWVIFKPGNMACGRSDGSRVDCFNWRSVERFKRAK